MFGEFVGRFVLDVWYSINTRHYRTRCTFIIEERSHIGPGFVIIYQLDCLDTFFPAIPFHQANFCSSLIHRQISCTSSTSNLDGWGFFAEPYFLDSIALRLGPRRERWTSFLFIKMRLKKLDSRIVYFPGISHSNTWHHLSGPSFFPIDSSFVSFSLRLAFLSYELLFISTQYFNHRSHSRAHQLHSDVSKHSVLTLDERHLSFGLLQKWSYVRMYYRHSSSGPRTFAGN